MNYRFLLSSMLCGALYFACGSLNVSAATPDDYVAGFQKFNGSVSTTWPINGVPMSTIEETFGPRIQPSTNAYDWHRGIDIDAPLGVPAKAATTGKLWKVTVYPDGGNTVILQHTFPTPVHYRGKTLPYFYTLYMHLDSVNPTLAAAAAKNLHPTVNVGDQIGTVGHSGSGAIGDHLHFELRLGTYCTLEFQLANPASSCSVGYGFDPAMHPLFLYKPTSSTIGLMLSTKPTAQADGKITLTLDRTQPLLNRLELRIKNKTTGNIATSSTLDFNQRTGYDASTEKKLDTPTKTKPYMSPSVFGPTAKAYITNLVLPAGYMSPYLSGAYSMTVLASDIWGNTYQIAW